MSRREKSPLSPERSELIELNSVECCALAHGFAKNPAAIVSLTEFIDEKTLKSASDGLVNSEHVAFLHNKHNEDVETAYEQIAEVELGRLRGDESEFHCAHSLDEHKKALQSVVTRFKKPAN